MTDSVLGIDLGTSSLKAILYCQCGTTQKVREKYDQNNPSEWKKALFRALEKIDCSAVSAVGLSSQVGTYVVNDETVLPWNSKVGSEELKMLKARYSEECFIKEISMPHPDIPSYPLPRLAYIKVNVQEIRSVCQPKDLLCEILTGRRVSDKYSFRGLCNMETGEYSSFFLSELSLSPDILPPLCEIGESVGYITKELCKRFGFRANTKVYTGLNDFYAALLGMGIKNKGDAFDITGTSEHFGVIEQKLVASTSLVSSEFFGNFVHYGVTASSGSSLRFSEKLCEEREISFDLIDGAPIFTPYINGERAPVFDADASGTFFGIGDNCNRQTLAYSVLEGIVFSIYHIYEAMGKPPINRIITCGGPSRNKLLTQIKAELFSVPVYVCKEVDTSALGAAMSTGLIENSQLCVGDAVMPTGKHRERLLKRYEIYKNIYPLLREQYKKFKEANK